MKNVLMTCAAVSALCAVPANAASVLYRVDKYAGTDNMAAALAALGHTVTTTSGGLSSFTLSNYDLVVYANQYVSQPGGDAGLLDGYITGGGKVIYTNWTRNGGELPSINSAFTYNFNYATVTLSQFSTGVASPFTLLNPGWGVFTTGLSALPGGSIAGTFSNGDAAIIVGNGGRTIHNGFLDDTGASSQFYQNEIGYLLGARGVPEPATWAMMILGLGAIGFTMRRGKAQAEVRFAF